jgi:hypothetical protein
MILQKHYILARDLQPITKADLKKYKIKSGQYLINLNIIRYVVYGIRQCFRLERIKIQLFRFS